MAEKNSTKKDKVEDPAATFQKPIDVVRAPDLSHEEKKKALNTWEQDARQLLAAETEGMSPSQEGLKREDANALDRVVRAKKAIGEKPKHNPTQ